MRGRETDGSERPCVSHACPPSTCYPATLHIVASVRTPVSNTNSPVTPLSRTYVKRAVHALPSACTCYSATLHSHRSVCPVRAPCPTRPLPPCLVRMLNEPFMQESSQVASNAARADARGAACRSTASRCPRRCSTRPRWAPTARHDPAQRARPRCAGMPMHSWTMHSWTMQSWTSRPAVLFSGESVRVRRGRRVGAGTRAPRSLSVSRAMHIWAMQSWAMQSWTMQSWTSRPAVLSAEESVHVRRGRLVGVSARAQHRPASSLNVGQARHSWPMQSWTMHSWTMHS